MKRALLLIALALTGCGNWSNADLEYLNAMPTRDTLQAQVKGAPASSSQPLSGTGTKKQSLFGNSGMPLNVGDHSEGYDETVNASLMFNNWISFIVSVVEFIETVQPTVRTKNSRVWGPYPDKDHPGFDLRITITKIDESHFTYAFEWKPSSTADGYFSLVDGTVTATTNLHHGVGSIDIHSKTARDHFGGWDGVDEVKINYDTRAFPTAVDVVATAANSAGELDWTYQNAEDTSGKLEYTIIPDPPLYNGGIVEIRANSYWLADGSGREDANVTKGTIAGANGTECWDANHNVTYQKYWDGTVHGDETKCPAAPFN